MPGNPNNSSQRLAQQQVQQSAQRQFQRFVAQQQANLQNQWKAAQIVRGAQREARKRQEEATARHANALDHQEDWSSGPEEPAGSEAPPFPPVQRRRSPADGSRTTFPGDAQTRKWVQPAVISLLVLTLGIGLILWMGVLNNPQPQPNPTPTVNIAHSSTPISPPPPHPSQSFSTPPSSPSAAWKGSILTVPGVIGDSPQTAEQILTAAGFRTKIMFATVPPGSPDFAKVIHQYPGPGSSASAGKTVTLTVGTTGDSTPTSSPTKTPTSTPTSSPTKTPTSTGSATAAPASMP
jgi:PASTA domain